MAEHPSDEYFRRLVDEDALRDYLVDHFGPADLAVERHQEGHSNETLFIQWGDRDLVLRRPPPGETAEKAHDVLREYRVMSALQDTPVPVPPTVAACDDDAVIGSDFYLMEQVDGHVLRYDEPARFANRTDREAIGEELIRTLAAIHEVDYEAVGLGEFGYPPGYTERQVGIWRKQFAWAFDVTAAEREIPALETVGDWLEEHCPDAHPHTLVHGDYKPDNI
ncbi:MAG: phosphotransferase family protein, partial [Halobacteriales archaeon]|nr:phosphotransferase family protein [Halobacteriales archaeon]